MGEQKLDELSRKLGVQEAELKKGGEGRDGRGQAQGHRGGARDCRRQHEAAGRHLRRHDRQLLKTLSAKSDKIFSSDYDALKRPCLNHINVKLFLNPYLECNSMGTLNKKKLTQPIVSNRADIWKPDWE